MQKNPFGLSLSKLIPALLATGARETQKPPFGLSLSKPIPAPLATGARETQKPPFGLSLSKPPPTASHQPFRKPKANEIEVIFHGRL